MDLKDGICHSYFLRDKGNKTPFLMSAENEMDPGELPAHLPELSQVEEMVIARSHVQMMVYRYRGHQYHYTGHCVSFLQSNAKMVDLLPTLPSELDVVVLQPPDQVMETDPRYRRQFRSDFRVRKGRVITWLQYLKAHHPDYRYITISLDRINALPVDGDVSASFIVVIDITIFWLKFSFANFDMWCELMYFLRVGSSLKGFTWDSRLTVSYVSYIYCFKYLISGLLRFIACTIYIVYLKIATTRDSWKRVLVLKCRKASLHSREDTLRGP